MACKDEDAGRANSASLGEPRSLAEQVTAAEAYATVIEAWRVAVESQGSEF